MILSQDILGLQMVELKTSNWFYAYRAAPLWAERLNKNDLIAYQASKPWWTFKMYC